MNRRLFINVLLILGTMALWGPTIRAWGGEADMNLSDADKKLLLQIARSSIEAHLADKPAPALGALSRSLCEPRGAFVSLHRQGQLRGCIGFLEAVKPLGQTVREMAAAAAFHDPRFRPLRKDELADLEVEISVLSPMRLINNLDEIKVGTHGLYIVQGSCRGLLLPQVATEYKWDRDMFLAQTCCKAGLSPISWKDSDTKIYLFTAEVFGDDPRKAGCALP
ncbi:MAG: AmmeMemoRadiSam system protein A [Deltaproteobacteria bacterium]|nr:AmmeMemoRadiSam system protein A [Deltaproteobacteria bacterium]